MERQNMESQNTESRKAKRARRAYLYSKRSGRSNSTKQSKQQESTSNDIDNKDIFKQIAPQAHTAIVVTEEFAQKPEPRVQDQQVNLTKPPDSPKTDQKQNDDVIIPIQENQTHDVPPALSDPLADEPEQFVLPETVTKLSTPSGAEVFLIGTAHFSAKSADDVRNVIRHVRPSAVILELCQERAFMLKLDEASLLEQNRKLSFDKIKTAIAEKGLAQGLIYTIFIKMSANLTEKLGLAPGSEFRAGAQEAREIPGCCVILGDRSLRVTVARAVASMSLWQKLSLMFHVITSDVSITQEDIEKFKEKDILEQMLQELGGSFPGFKRVILDERNIYLAHSIYEWAQLSVTSHGPQTVVAVVGLGHVGGIVENWGKTKVEDIRAINGIPEVSKTRRVVTKAVKYCTLALVFYIGYRAIVPSDIQVSIQDKVFCKVLNRWK